MVRLFLRPLVTPPPLAAPTAIMAYTMAVELNGEESLTAGTISLSVLASLVLLALIVTWA